MHGETTSCANGRAFANEHAAKNRTVANRAVRAHVGAPDEAQRRVLSPERIAARFNLVGEAGIADDREVLGAGAGIPWDRHASAVLAYLWGRPEVAEVIAVCQALDWCVVAPICWIATVLSAFAAVVTHRRREVTHPVRVVARVIGARVAVVTRDPLAEVLSTHAVYTDARNAIEGAVRSYCYLFKLLFSHLYYRVFCVFLLYLYTFKRYMIYLIYYNLI